MWGQHLKMPPQRLISSFFCVLFYYVNIMINYLLIIWKKAIDNGPFSKLDWENPVFLWCLIGNHLH